MAGYLGTKAVLLSTTAADVIGNAEIGGDLTVGGAFTSQGIDDNASATAMTLDAAGNVGIGVVPQNSSGTWRNFEQGGMNMAARSSGAVDGMVGTNYVFKTDNSEVYKTTGAASRLFFNDSAMQFQIAASGTAGNAISWDEAMRIDSSGNLLVGKTALNTNAAGLQLENDGYLSACRDGGNVALINRKSSDGSIVTFQKDGSTVGSITSGGDRTMFNGLPISHNGGTGFGFGYGTISGNPIFIPCDGSYNYLDNVADLGFSSARFDDIYATNGTIQTSDRNEKQDIEALSDAEQRVAVACKGLLRKFRWKDAVAEKGDDARIHFGIIAQDLQDAFAAEGLEAGRYAMFISSTWWETQTDVPAVEAVEAVEATYDEDGNELTPAVEAVEAKEAYTRTDTYETQAEAPEGATERTRLGVRYPELLAFIIGVL